VEHLERARQLAPEMPEIDDILNIVYNAKRGNREAARGCASELLKRSERDWRSIGSCAPR